MAGVALAAVVVGVAQWREPADAPPAEDLPGTTSAGPEEPSQPTLDAVGLPEDVISRVDGARPKFESRSPGAPEMSHIGPRLDPEAAGYAPGDGRPSHIGEYLDPDDDSVSRVGGEVSHIGEHLDPVADDPDG